jgi:hypothetical protein
MPVPTPHGGESQDDFIGRCMRWMHTNDSQRPQDQMQAMCFQQWRDRNKNETAQAADRASGRQPR